VLNASHQNNAGKAVFRPHSLIREKHSGQGYNKRLKKNLHLAGSIFFAALAANAATLHACVPTHYATLRQVLAVGVSACFPSNAHFGCQ